MPCCIRGVFPREDFIQARGKPLAEMDDEDDGLFTLEDEEGCSRRVLDEVGDERAGLLNDERRDIGVASTRAASGEAEGAGTLLLRRLAAVPFIRQYAGALSCVACTASQLPPPHAMH
jgi:hypothetical protein